MTRRSILPLGQALVAALAIAALAVLVSGAGIARAQSTTSVSIANFAFDPGTVTVQAGDTVTWTNNDSVAHTVTAADGSFDSGAIAPGGTFSMTFDTPGTIAYSCTIHPNMRASIVVQAASSGSSSGSQSGSSDNSGSSGTSGGSSAGKATSLPNTGSGTASGGTSWLLLPLLGGALLIGLVALRLRRQQA
jgi:plastocyanin